MPRHFRVIWVCDILAVDEIQAAETARRTIATSPYSYFEVYDGSDTEAAQIEVPNSGRYMDGGISYTQPKNNQTN